jgi:transposase
MFRLDARLKVYVHREAVDFRKSINGLAALVEQAGLDPFAPALFAFSNQRHNRIKLLGWDGNGFWLMMKRLEEGRFAWPRRQQTVMEATAEQLHWLLEGIDIDAVRRHPARQYRHTG